jgi:hypothetical protein
MPWRQWLAIKISHSHVQIYLRGDFKSLTQVHFFPVWSPLRFWWWESLQSSLAYSWLGWRHWRVPSCHLSKLWRLWACKQVDLKLPCATLCSELEKHSCCISICDINSPWFNFVLIPKVWAQRMLPASLEDGTMTESLLGKQLECLRWNKQHPMFNPLDLVVLFNKAFLSLTR